MVKETETQALKNKEAPLHQAGPLQTMGLSGCFSVNADSLLILRTFELHLAINEGVQGVIVAHSDIDTLVKLSAALPNEDGSGRDNLAAVALDAQPLRV